MPITIEVHQGGDRTTIAMLIATICLVVAALAQVVVATFQATAANRQARAAEQQAAAAQLQSDAADRQVAASERAVRAARELEDRRTMPWLAITLSGVYGDGNASLRIRNQGAGPALLISVGRHQRDTMILEPDTLLALSDLSLDVGAHLDVSLTMAMLRQSLFVHCQSAQSTELIYEVFAHPNGRLVSSRLAAIPAQD
jgi:hypothetical protein